jgi:hypothetical protein
VFNGLYPTAAQEVTDVLASYFPDATDKVAFLTRYLGTYAAQHTADSDKGVAEIVLASSVRNWFSKTRGAMRDGGECQHQHKP